MKLRNIKLTLEYDGTFFYGWQMQESSKRTVQGEIKKVLKIIFKKKIQLIGSGRTDRGVHALGQVANFKVTSRMPVNEILRAMNGNLPVDIAVTQAEEVALDFHAQYSAKKKTYRYTVCNRVVRSVLQRQFCLHVPQKLNLFLLRRESRNFIGVKDFSSFAASDPQAGKEGREKTTIRKIYKLDIKKKGDSLCIDIEANGFLYKMARNIVGTLIKIGLGKLPEGSVVNILKARNRKMAAETAQPQGLCLLQVIY